MVGEIFDHYYQFGSLTSPPLNGIQTATIPPGGAGILEVKASMPGKFTLMDHAISRMEKGNMAILEVKGPENTALMHAGQATPAVGVQEISGVTAADVDEVDHIKVSSAALAVPESAMNMTGGMNDMASMSSVPPPFSLKSIGGLIGCLTNESDGKTMLRLFHSQKVYRLEAQPFLFEQNEGRTVHVTGHFGSVVEVEDPHVPSYVVDTVETITPNCSTKTTFADLEKALAPPEAPVGGVVSMGSTSFEPATITINAGEQVVWKNTSDVLPQCSGRRRESHQPSGRRLSVRNGFIWLWPVAARHKLLSRLQPAGHISLRVHGARNQWDERNRDCADWPVALLRKRNDSPIAQLLILYPKNVGQIRRRDDVIDAARGSLLM